MVYADSIRVHHLCLRRHSTFLPDLVPCTKRRDDPRTERNTKPMRRHCFELQLKTDQIDAYRERHSAVWPEMLRALKEAGWHNYSLFLRADGLLIGYVESEDLKGAQKRMSHTEVNRLWQFEMSQFFADLPGNPDENFVELEEIFNLEDELDKIQDQCP